MSRLSVDVERVSGSKLQLYGEGVRPRLYSERTVKPSGLITIWFAMAIHVSLFQMGGEVAGCMSVWKVPLILLIANTITCIVMWFTQDIGIRYGIPFVVSLRPAFGYVGAHIPSFLRGVPAIYWFGFMTWIGAGAVNELTKMFFNFDNLTVAIIGFGLVQIISTSYGIKAISYLSNVSSPLLLATGIYLLVRLFMNSDLSFVEVMKVTGTDDSYDFMAGILAFIGGWATMSFSIMDITRECVVTEKQSDNWWESTKRFSMGQWLGLTPAAVLFGTIGAVGYALTGHFNPIELTAAVLADQPFVLAISMIVMILASWTTNDSGNLFPAAYFITSIFPKKINFSKGVIIAGLVGLAIRPWSIAGGSLMGACTFFGSILAPVIGILIVDYYLLRRRELNVEDLYADDGQYKYWHNINPAGILALIIGAAVSWPFFKYIYFVGLLVGGLSYYFLMKYWIVKVYPQSDISLQRKPSIDHDSVKA